MKQTKRPTRRTSRLIIRPLERGDYSAWKTAWSTMLPAQNAWDRSNRPAEALTRAEFSKVLKRLRAVRSKDQFHHFGVFLSSTGELIGTVSAMDVLRGLSQSAYLGYSLFNRHWGRGYGKEAVRAMIDIAFRDLKLHRLEAGIEPRNRRSILLARALKLRKEGLKRRAVFLKGKWVDLVMYSITSEEVGMEWKGNAQTRPR
jgi:ribosomal-protein-alanine N-acetyltransferase